MARESHGLHAALIILFLLVIVLGVTTYLFARWYIETDELADKLETELRDKTEDNGNLEDANSRLKKMILGTDGAEALELVEIDAQFNTDMQTFAGAYEGVSKYYRPVLVHLHDLVNQKNRELTELHDSVLAMQADFDARRDQLHAQMKQEQNEKRLALEALNEARATYTAALQQIRAEKDQLQQSWDRSREDAASQQAAQSEALAEADNRADRLSTRLKTQSDELDRLKEETIEVADGRICGVAEATGTVWIDLGRADELRPQVTFSVYPIDLTNLAKARKKASIEVTRIRGDHLAEARILEDDPSDPIMIEDKVYTPAWSPGEPASFALNGMMDLDHDGRSDIDRVRELIETGGGRVDFWVDREGEFHGEMTIHTQYVVVDSEALELGDNPSELDIERAQWRADIYTEVILMADQFAIKKISLGALTHQMGWKDQTPVVHFGRDADSEDFPPRLPEGVTAPSSGTVSPLFGRGHTAPGELIPRGGAY